MEVLAVPLIDRAVVLNLGRVLTEGRPAEVVRNPDVIKAYLGDRYVCGLTLSPPAIRGPEGAAGHQPLGRPRRRSSRSSARTAPARARS